MSTNPSLPLVECPTTKQLREWLDGGMELPKNVQQHIEDCPRCSSSLAGLTDDESLNLMAARARAQPLQAYSSEPEFEQLRSLLNAWSLDGLASKSASQSVNPGEHEIEPAAVPPEFEPNHELVSTHRAGFESTDIEAPTLDVLPLETLGRGLPPGRYAIERLIAAGGAGAVYLAYDQRLQREVAIKILARDSMRDRQRFLREARTLAELEHPNIVRIFDFGALAIENNARNTGVPSEQTAPLYLVMEYLAGGACSSLRIDASTDETARLPVSPADSKFNALEYFRKLARLIATAADGLAAAHAKGLVHRDVKPGNLLLTADRLSIKVADFGLARLSDSDATQVTRTGDVLGTPVFMSPEQVSPDSILASSSDIYSLGATLYQLITGLAPYQGGQAAILRQVAESSPVAPRLINPSIPIDLETICLHAMEREPAARYASMEQFAADLRRFSAGDSIHARPVSTINKAIRFLRNNPSFTSALVVCVLLACLLTLGSATAAYVYHQKNRQLEVAADNERLAKQSAENALKESITAADDLLLAVTTETDMLPRAPGSQEVARKLLERARDYFQRFLDANEGNATLTYQLARAHAGLGAVAMRVGDAATLERETAAAIALIDLIPSSELAASKRAELKCDTLIVLANYYIESGDAKLAIPLLDNAINTVKTIIDDPEEASDVGLEASYATGTLGLANAYTWVGKRDDAIPLLISAKALFGKLRVKAPDNPSYLRSAAACDMTLATVALDLDRASEAKEHLADAFKLLSEVGENDAISLRVREMKIKVLTNLALAERRTGNNLEAKAGYEAAMAESRRLIELEPGVPSHQWNLVVASLNSGGPDIELGTLDTLIERWQGTLPVLEQLIAGEPENRRYQQVKAMLQSNIAIVLRDMGKLDEAIVPLQAATETLRQQAEQLDYAPETYLPVALNLYELASTWFQLNQFENAVEALDQSDGVVDEILSRDPAFTPALGHLLDSLHVRLALLKKQPTSDLTQRQSVAERSLSLARELASNQPDVAEYQIELPRALNDHAQVLFEASQFEAALQAVHESRGLLAELLGKAEIVPPEMKECEKVALLLETRTSLQLTPDTSSPEVRDKLQSLLMRAREFGASEEDISALQLRISMPSN